VLIAITNKDVSCLSPTQDRFSIYQVYAPLGCEGGVLVACLWEKPSIKKIVGERGSVVGNWLAGDACTKAGHKSIWAGHLHVSFQDWLLSAGTGLTFRSRRRQSRHRRVLS